VNVLATLNNLRAGLEAYRTRALAAEDVILEAERLVGKIRQAAPPETPDEAELHRLLKNTAKQIHARKEKHAKP
jgi:hypothetical protein